MSIYEDIRTSLKKSFQVEILFQCGLHTVARDWKKPVQRYERMESHGNMGSSETPRTSPRGLGRQHLKLGSDYTARRMPTIPNNLYNPNAYIITILTPIQLQP